jgi:hypothetical protein
VQRTSHIHEISRWALITEETISKFRDEDMIVDEFALVFSLREQFPLHFSLFKRLAADLPHEGNAESTFSLSGSLSSDNTHSSPDVLSTYVRINRNRSVYNPRWEEVFKAYRSKFGKVPSPQHPALPRLATTPHYSVLHPPACRRLIYR